MSKPLNIVVQLLDQKTGARSRPVTKTREEFANLLEEMLPENAWDKTYVLVLADDSVKTGSLDFALAPLMTVTTFVENFSTFKLKGQTK